MRGFAIVALVALGACGGTPAKPAVKPPPPPPAQPPSDPFAPWPMAMTVYTWTPEGLARVGELPRLPASAIPTTPWYVEPNGPLDEAAFNKVVAALRSQHVPGLSLRGQQAVAPWLGRLRDLPELTALILDDAAIDPAQLAAIDLPLRRLYLARTVVDDAVVAPLIARNSKLEVLDLEDTGVGDATARAVGALPELHALNLSGTRITDVGGAALRALAKLEIVDLGRTVVGAPTVAALRDLAIRELFLDRTRVGKEIATLAVFAPGIRRFDVSALTMYKPTDADVAWLAQAPELLEVGLSGSVITDKLALEIVKLPNLERIRFAATRITLATIRAIAARVDLREVDLAATPVDDKSAAELIGGQVLQILRLDDTPITDAALTALPGLGLGQLYLSRTKVTDAGLVFLERVPHLIGLGLGETAIGDATLARIAKLSDLQVLVLSKVRAETAALDGLGALRGLQSVYLEGTFAGDTTVAVLAKAPLRILHLASTNVSDAGLGPLRALRELRELTLGDTRIHGLGNLDAWPRLHTLSLVGLAIADNELPAIAKRGSIELLDLSATDVTDPAPLLALPRLVQLGLSQTRISKTGETSVRALRKRGIDVVR